MCCPQKYLPQLLGTQAFMQVAHRKLPHPALWDRHRLSPAATSPCEVRFLLQEHPLWSPVLGDNQLQISSNHPTSYGHLPLWSPFPVVNPPGHLYFRFMLTSRRKKPFLPLFTPPHPQSWPFPAPRHLTWGHMASLAWQAGRPSLSHSSVPELQLPPQYRDKNICLSTLL